MKSFPLFVALVIVSLGGNADAFAIQGSGPQVTTTGLSTSVNYVGNASGQVATERLFSRLGSGASMAEKVAIGTTAGALAVTATSTIGKAAIAKTLFGALPGVGTAIALSALSYDLYKAFKDARVSPGPNGMIVTDAGSPPVDIPLDGVNCGFGGGFMSVAACTAVQVNNCKVVYGTTGSNSSSCIDGAAVDGSSDIGTSHYVHFANGSEMLMVRKLVAGGCQPSPGSYFNVPGDRPEPSSDGKCPGGTVGNIPAVDFSNDVSPQAQAAADAVWNAIADSRIDPTLKWLADRRALDVADPPVLSGPSTIAGPPKTSTTTNPDGSTSTKVEEPTYGVTYMPGVVQLDAKFKTTVTDVPSASQAASGALPKTTTTTTTTNGTTPTETVDPCVANPGRAGCVLVGVPDPVADVVRKDVPVSITADPAFSGAGGCPASIGMDILTRHVEFSYVPLCAALTDYVKPVLLACALAMAAFVFIGGLKS